jgi:hypothetical protein
MSHDTTTPKAGEYFFIVLLFVFSVFLLSQLGEQTSYSTKGKLVAQPAFWPAIAVGGMTLFSGLHLLTRYQKNMTQGLGFEIFTWAKTLEYVAWFMVYVNAVPYIGYLPATLIFCLLLAFRLGYRRKQTLLLAMLTGFGIVVGFKTLLSVKIPGGAVYEYLPQALRNLMIINF